MNKNMKKVVEQFLSMDISQRNELFSRSHEEIPSIKARAKLFVLLPIDESVRLLSEINSIEMDDFIFEDIFNLLTLKTKDIIFNDLLPKLPIGRLVSLVFRTGPFMIIDNLFNLLPLETVIAVIDEGNKKNEEHDKKTFEILERIKVLAVIQKENLQIILARIQPESFKSMIEYSFQDLGKETQKIMIDCVSDLGDEKRIAVLCKAVTTRKAISILINIKDQTKQRNVLQLLPQEYKDAFFNRTSKRNKDVLNSSEIDVDHLSLQAKKRFFRKFPKSKQMDKLSIGEKIEIFS